MSLINAPMAFDVPRCFTAKMQKKKQLRISTRIICLRVYLWCIEESIARFHG